MVGGISVRAGQFLGVRKIFAGISANLPKEFFVRNFGCKSSPTKIVKTILWCDLQKEVFVSFSANGGRNFMKSKTLGVYFLSQGHWASFLPGFAGILS